MSSKKKIAILGNCQIYAIKSYLLGNKQFCNEYDVVLIPPVFQISNGNDILKSLQTVDYIISQPLYSPVGGCNMKIDALKAIGNKLIIFTNAYFNGYNPELFYLKINGSIVINSFLDYTLANILYSYLSGHSILQCIDIWYANKLTLSDRKSAAHIAINNANASICELKARELVCDVAVADYISDRMFEERLFYTINHPNALVMNSITDQIFKILLGNSLEYNNSNIDLFSHTNIPILSAVRSAFSFYDNTTDFKVKDQYYNVEYVVTNYYEWFSLYSNQQLKTGLFEHLNANPQLFKLLKIV